MTIDQVIFLKFKQFLLNFVIDSINRRFIIYEKFDAIYQKINQKVNVFKISLKKIKRKWPFFNEYYNVMLFLVKLISVLKNKLFIMKNVFNDRRLFYSKSLCKKLHWVVHAKMTTTIIINIKTINFSIINWIEINNLTKSIILINLKRIISQIIILTRKRTTNVHMRKWKMKKIFVVLNVINRDIIIEIVQRKINEIKQL